MDAEWILNGKKVSKHKHVPRIDKMSRNMPAPKCDFCGADAKYDGKTKMGPWAYMCEGCHNIHGVNVKGLSTPLIKGKHYS